jgi:hypothetical protein
MDWWIVCGVLRGVHTTAQEDVLGWRSCLCPVYKCNWRIAQYHGRKGARR